MSDVRVVFMGSPEFALPTLRALHETFNVVGVVTQPDRRAGRGRKLASPPVKTLAQELGLPLIQPERLSEEAAMEQLRRWSPDLIVVAAFGQILRPGVLYLPPHGCINVHASLLPRWRGAAPIQAAILAGDRETGITIMRMDEGVDTGPILSQRAIAIRPDDTAATLGARLADLGAELLLETLPIYLKGKITPQPQPEGGATRAPLLKKEDGRLDFTRPVVELERRVRAMFPWPVAFMEWEGGRLRVLRARVGEGSSPGPGTRFVVQERPAVGALDGVLILEEVQPAGRKAMPGKAFLAGARQWASLESTSQKGVAQ